MRRPPVGRSEFVQAAYLAALAGGATPDKALAAMIAAIPHYDQMHFDTFREEKDNG